MKQENWTKEQLKLAFHVYCQLPFGRLHHRNSEVIKLARLIERTPSAVAMKLTNFASLDPSIINSGRKGLGNASKLDREVWDESHANWEQFAVDAARLRESMEDGSGHVGNEESPENWNYLGTSRIGTSQIRIKQDFFRRAVLSSYGARCCMSGISEPRLLIASHIKPWALDRQNRLNPQNGLCLSALHDRAFDQGLVTVTPDFRISVSKELVGQHDNSVMRSAILDLDERFITLPERFAPDKEFLQWHLDNRFRRER